MLSHNGRNVIANKIKHAKRINNDTNARNGISTYQALKPFPLSPSCSSYIVRTHLTSSVILSSLKSVLENKIIQLMKPLGVFNL